MRFFIRFFLFLFPPEVSHHLALKGLRVCHLLKLTALMRARIDARPLELFGLGFGNRVGLAAGLDKNGDYIDALGALGFGFIEVGTVTPKPQAGNPKPRLFRLARDRAIINRMGFNNKGVDHMVRRLKKRRYQGIVGVNIGKNALTPVESAVDDYLICLRCVYEFADYVVVNLSSPNTPGLRQLQFGVHLQHLLGSLKKEQAELATAYQKHVPLLVKIAPDLDGEEIRSIAATLLEQGIEGVVATNTTIGRRGIEGSPGATEGGGLSGAPLTPLARGVLQELADALDGKIPIISVGGIMDGDEARIRIAAGASLVQIYSGFIYEGPGLIGCLLKALDETAEQRS